MRSKNRQQQGFRSFRKVLNGFAGFTLIELMVGMVAGGLIAAFIMGAYLTTARNIKEQRDISIMHMNQRGSIEDMELQLRMVGYDPEADLPRNLFGVTDVKRYDITNELTQPVPLATGSPGLTIVYDNYDMPGGADGALDANDFFVSYRLFDEGFDGIYELARDVEPGDKSGMLFPREILAENVHAIAFAYAVDDDKDSELDTINNEVIWAIDTDNDNVLDFNLDVNNDGEVTKADDSDGNKLINAGDIGPGKISTTYPVTSIRAVKIWLLVRAEKPTKNYRSQKEYHVGDRIIVPASLVSNNYLQYPEALKCRRLVRTVDCRNLWVTP